MYLCRFSVRYASSANSVFKPINFKYKVRLGENTKPYVSKLNKKYDGNSRGSSRDDRGNHRSAKERDEEGLPVIRSPMAPIEMSDYGNRGFVDDSLRRPSRDQSYEGNLEDGDGRLPSRRRNHSSESDLEDGDRRLPSRRRNHRSEGDLEDGDGHLPSRRRNNDDVGVLTNRGKYENYREESNYNQGRFRGRQSADYRPGKSDSGFNNDEFRPRNRDYRQGIGEHDRGNCSNKRHVWDHQDTGSNNSRMRRHDGSDYGSKKHVKRSNDDKLLVLSSDSSVGDVEKLFGIHPVLLALRAGKRTIHKIVCKQGIEKTNIKIKEIYELAADNSIEFVSVHSSEFKKIFKGDTVHQGIFCLASPLPISIFDIDSCQELQIGLIDSARLEDPSKTKSSLGCSDEGQRSPPGDEINNSSLNSNKIEQRCKGDAPLGSISDNLSGQEEHGSGTFSAHTSLNSSLNIEPADSNPTQATSETIPNSTSCTEPSVCNATPLSVLPDESPTGISSTASLSTMALSSAVAFAAMQPEQNDTSGEDHLTAVPSSEAGSERDGSRNTMVTSSSELWQQSEAQSKPQLWLLLDSVTDAMNVGAVLRSCCYFGVDRVLFTPSCAEISPVVSKASSGAAELLSLSRVPQPGSALAALRGRGWTVLVAVSRGAESPHMPLLLYEFAMTGNTLLVVGNEGSGVSTSISEQADASVTIPATGPLAGELGCLNVSVAAAITLHALTARERQGDMASNNRGHSNNTDSPSVVQN